MAELRRQPRDDRLGRAGGLEAPGRERIAQHAVVGAEVQVVAVEGDAGAAQLAELSLDIGPAIAVRVAERDDANAGFVSARRPERDEDVAVRRHG